MKYILARLLSGDNIIGKLNTTEEYVEDVHLISMMPDETGRFTISLLPIMFPFKREGSTIDVGKLMVVEDAPQDLIDAYVQTVTGIEIARPLGIPKGDGLKILK